MKKIKKGKNRSWTDKELITAVNQSLCITDVIKKLGLGITGGNAKSIKNHINKLKINTDHFLNVSQILKLRRLNGSGGLQPKHDNDIFIENSPFSRCNLKKRLISKKDFNYQCSSCGLRDFYNGKTLSLQVDHINGVFNDNRLENLRLLCPNCHSQTDNFAGKNKPKKIKPLKLNDRSHMRKVNYDLVILKYSEMKNYTKVGKELNISGNAVKKIYKKYGPKP